MSKKKGRGPWTAAQKKAFKETIRKRKEEKMKSPLALDKKRREKASNIEKGLVESLLSSSILHDEFDHLRTIIVSLNSMKTDERRRTFVYLRSRYSTDWPTDSY